MSSIVQKHSLDSWLDYIAAVHPSEIDLGLERIRRVAERMGLDKVAPRIITVAGTNGKGSTVACLEAVLEECGYRTAAYTSPHIHRFNERIRLRRVEASDERICRGLAEVDAARGPESLSYFEFSTLAALWLFQQTELDVALLEVGLGGRLDAVNIIDADVAVITNISIDHEDWLGTGLENIGREKAGILRTNGLGVIGATEIPDSIVAVATDLNTVLTRAGADFSFTLAEDEQSWDWQGIDAAGNQHSMLALPLPEIALVNVSLALQVLNLLPLNLPENAVRQALKGLGVAGRFERRSDLSTGTKLIFDVAHNPAAAQLLASNLQRYRRLNPACGQITVVFAVMADKDIEAMVSALETSLDNWHISQVDEPRCSSADATFRRIKDKAKDANLLQFESVNEAYESACLQAQAEDLVVVTGSFFTVAAVRELSETEPS